MIEFISLDLIDSNPWQTRIGEPDPEYVKELALDIAERSLLQTPIGRRNGENIQLAFGHNRFAAYKWLAEQDASRDEKIGYDLMPIDVRELTDEQMAELAWAENEKRRDVTPIERAYAIQQRMEHFGWSQAEAAQHLSIDRSTVSNILRLLKLPEKIRGALSVGDISERAAIALLPMYDLPEHVLDKAKGDCWYGPADIERNALNGMSSDELRQRVNRLRDNYTRQMQKAEFKLDDMFPEGLVLGYDGSEGGSVYCATCRPCDRRIADNGNVCLDIGCFKAKTALHRRRYLAAAATAAGIEVVDPNKGGNPTPLPWHRWEDGDSRARQIISMKCENLRLVYSETAEKGDGRLVDGHPHALIVCDKRNGSCACIKGLELLNKQPKTANQVRDEELEQADIEIPVDVIMQGPADSDETVCAQTYSPATPTASQMEELARQARKDKKDVAGAHMELVERLTELAIEWLRYDEPGAFHVLVEGYATPSTYRKWDLETLYRKAAAEIARTIAGRGDADSVDELYRITNMKLEALKLPAIGRHKTLIEIYQEEEKTNA